MPPHHSGVRRPSHHQAARREFTDLVSFDQYIGWYDGLPDKTARISWSIEYPKPVVISEFGADALQGWHRGPLTRFSEEYQEDLYRKTIATLRKIPAWRGVTPWILADFRSPRRVLPNVQDGWNRKGPIGENGTKKKVVHERARAAIGMPCCAAWKPIEFSATTCSAAGFWC